MVSTTQNQTVFVRLPSPFPSAQYHLPVTAALQDLPLPSTLQDYLESGDVFLRSSTSPYPLDPNIQILDLQNANNTLHPITLHLTPRLLGGKGGFGTQLRAAGGRMSLGKSTNVDACRDLSGRRLSTIKEAQRQAELLESAPALRAAAIANDKARLEGLERSLGVSAPGEKGEGGESSGSKRIAEVDVEELARKKYKFEDSKFLEESREINDSVRSAVSKAMLLKKKKKPKTDVSAEPAKSTSTTAKAGVEAAKKAEKDKVAMPPPATTPTATSAVSAA